MINLYIKTQYDKIKAKQKKKRNLLVFILCLIIVLFLGTCFFLTYENRAVLQWILGGELCIGGWICIFILLKDIRPLQIKIKMYELFFDANAIESVGKISTIGRTITLRKGVLATEVTLNDGKDKKVFYYDHSLGDIPFLIEQKICLWIVDGFIIAYEVQNEE